MNEFDQETERAREIVRDRPPYWQFHLAAELLRSKLSVIEKGRESLNQVSVPGKTTNFGNAEFAALVVAMLKQLTNEALPLLRTAVMGMSFEVGTDAEIKEPLEIRSAVDRLISAYEGVLTWELAFVVVEPPEAFERIGKLIPQATQAILDPVRHIPDEMLKPVQPPYQGGTYNTVFKEDLSKVVEIAEELDRFMNHSGTLEVVDEVTFDAHERIEQGQIQQEADYLDMFWFSGGKANKRSFIALISDTPDPLYEDEPMECRTHLGSIVYLNCTPLPVHRRARSEEWSLAFNVLWHIISTDDRRFRDPFSRIEELNKRAAQKGSSITSTLARSIDKAFAMAEISGIELYSPLELKPPKRESARVGHGIRLAPRVQARIDYIDHSIKHFIKRNQIYAGLSFLKDAIPCLEYGFPVYEAPNIDKTNHGNEIIFYTSDINWHYKGDLGIDSGRILDKIVESLLLLLSHTGCVDAIVDIYQELQEGLQIRLKADGLVRLIEALLKHDETEVLEVAIRQLRSMEPQHPIIEEATRSIRRKQTLEQYGKATDMDLSSIHTMGGIDFERFLKTLFIKKGFRVERTKASGDFGADLIIEAASGTRVAVQAKRFKQKTNLKAVQEVVAALPHYAADFGIVIALAGFFPSAINLAKSNGVELWDEDKLIRFLNDDLSFSMLSDANNS